MEKAPEQKDRKYMQVSPLMLFPGSESLFSVFLKQEGEYVLYAKEGERLSIKHRRTLHENGVAEVYIRCADRERYTKYVEENLANMLNDDDTPMHERAAILYNASTEVVRNLFDEYLPEAMDEEKFERIVSMVRGAIKYLTMENALKTLAKFISHDYQTYSHCVQVFVYTTCTLFKCGYTEDAMVNCGLGAMLHDLGKVRIPKSILTKPGKLTNPERLTVNTHPLQGISMLTHLPLSSETYNCVLFHHEMLDGRGYPGGLRGVAIPHYVRALTICDVYDALTSERSYARAMRPYQALRIMRDDMKTGLDMDIFKSFIAVLSGAEIV